MTKRSLFFIVSMFLLILTGYSSTLRDTSEEVIGLRSEVLKYSSMAYTEFLDAGGKEAELYHENRFVSNAYDLEAEVIFIGIYDEDLEESILSENDRCLRLQGTVESLFNGITEKMSQELFLEMLSKQYSLDYSYEEGAGTTYYISDHYLHIVCDPLDENGTELTIDIDINDSEQMEEKTACWINFIADNEQEDEDNLSQSETVPGNDFVLYHDILQLYSQSFLEKWDEDKNVQNNLVRSITYPYWIENTDDIFNKEGFAFIDLNKDGINELLLGWIGNEFWNMDEGYFFAGYTIIDEEIVLAIEGWNRNQYVIGKDGYIYNSGSLGASDSTYLKLNFNTNYENYLEPVEKIQSQYDSDTDIWWEYATNPEGLKRIEQSGKHEDLRISQEDALAIGKAWMESGEKLDYTLFSDYIATE